MAMKNLGYIGLPEHRGNGGFDHAAVHAASGHVYVAHTANDAVDVFDPASQKFLFSVPTVSREWRPQQPARASYHPKD